MDRASIKRDAISVGLIQGKDFGSKKANLNYTLSQIKDAAKQGAQIICTQELFNTSYFCSGQNTEHFNLAETIPGPTSDTLCALAKGLGVVIIAAYFEKRSSALYHNTAVIIDNDGTLLGRYRKMHIPQDPSFEEKFYFTPGDNDFPVWETAFGKIGVMICWDQWFPEAARLMALKGAEILFYPTAIGWLLDEKQTLGQAQYNAWETVQKGHAIANGCYLAAINRVGYEDGIEFWGQSFLCDSYGTILNKASEDEAGIVVVKCDMQALEDTRKIWPFFRDRRPDLYQPITKSFLDES